MSFFILHFISAFVSAAISSVCRFVSHTVYLSVCWSLSLSLSLSLSFSLSLSPSLTLSPSLILYVSFPTRSHSFSFPCLFDFRCGVPCLYLDEHSPCPLLLLHSNNGVKECTPDNHKKKKKPRQRRWHPLKCFSVSFIYMYSEPAQIICMDICKKLSPCPISCFHYRGECGSSVGRARGRVSRPWVQSPLWTPRSSPRPVSVWHYLKLSDVSRFS